MQLHEIIATNEQLLDGTANVHGLSYEQLAPYKKSLLTYFAAKWPEGTTPVFVATFVTNSICAGVIAPDCELCEVYDILTQDVEDEQERADQVELLAYQTIKFA